MSTPRHIVAVAGLVSAIVREVLEETDVRVAVGPLVGIYSNVRSHIVMLDFLCEFVGGELTMSDESLKVEWVERAEALSRVIRPAIRDRLRGMLEFDGQVVYRAYSFDAGKVTTGGADLGRAVPEGAKEGAPRRPGGFRLGADPPAQRPEGFALPAAPRRTRLPVARLRGARPDRGPCLLPGGDGS